MESTAALIPFDRLFKFSAAELTAEYRVNLFKKVKEENAEILGMFGEEAEAAEKFGGSESEAEAEGENEAEGDSEKEEDVNYVNEASEKTASDNSNAGKKSKKNKKVARKMRELEYDYDDPFIDDSEITDVYQSVFELMRGGSVDDRENDDDEEEEEKVEKRSNVKTTKERNFFVYRGTMTPEILAKEFEIDVEELLEGEAAASDEELEGEEEKSKKESKKRKTSGSNGTAVKKPKTVKQKEPKEPKKPKELKEPKKPKEPKEAKKKKPSDLIAQSAKKFNDLFSNEDANDKTTTTSVAVFNVSGVDSNLLELREVLKRFRDAAVGTPFSPGKFPSALRPRLNESICTVLRVCRPTPSALFPAKMFAALASFLPFSPAALNKLLTKKILWPLMEGIEKNELPKMYENWRKMIENRIIEGGFIEVASVSASVSASVTSASVNGHVTEDQQQQQQQQQLDPFSPVKKRLKFSDEMRQQVFEIVRMETDLNNLFCLSNLIESANAAAASNENLNVSVALRSVQSELNLRKIVYQKLMNLSSEANGENCGVPLLSTTEISKEFGAQKRKHEKKVSKAASEILFGEAEVEELLKELDVRKEPPQTQAQAQVQVQEKLPMDPLNLFCTEAPANNHVDQSSNTSLFIESNQ